MGRRAVAVYGGVPIGAQIQEVRRGADILIATPGRLIDLLERGAVLLDKCTFLVLDEADRMLEMGFLPPIRKIIQRV